MFIETENYAKYERYYNGAKGSRKKKIDLITDVLKQANDKNEALTGKQITEGVNSIIEKDEEPYTPREISHIIEKLIGFGIVNRCKIEGKHGYKLCCKKLFSSEEFICTKKDGGDQVDDSEIFAKRFLEGRFFSLDDANIEVYILLTKHQLSEKEKIYCDWATACKIEVKPKNFPKTYDVLRGYREAYDNFNRCAYHWFEGSPATYNVLMKKFARILFVLEDGRGIDNIPSIEKVSDVDDDWLMMNLVEQIRNAYEIGKENISIINELFSDEDEDSDKKKSSKKQILVWLDTLCDYGERFKRNRDLLLEAICYPLLCLHNMRVQYIAGDSVAYKYYRESFGC